MMRSAAEYAGNAIATVRSSDPKKLVSVRATAFEAAPEQGGSAASGVYLLRMSAGVQTSTMLVTLVK